MAKKEEKVIEKFDLENWLSSLNNFSLPKFNDLPTIQLYMDQVITYITSSLKPFIDDDSFLTASMINNYVKGKVIKAPNGKKYDNESLAQLFFISLVKQVLSIKEIKDILDNDIITHYDELIDYENDILDKTINNIKDNLDLDNYQKSLFKIALELAIDSQIKKIMVDKIIQSLVTNE